MRDDQQAIVPSQAPGLRNPNKTQNLRPGRGAEGRKKHVRSLANKLRRYLESPKGVDERGQNRRDRIFATLVEIAEDPRHPHAVAAAQVLLDRAYGRPRPSDEELDAAKGGLQIVYINRSGLEDVPKMEPRPAPRPEFIDAEIVLDRQE